MRKLILIFTLLFTTLFADTINFKAGWNFIGLNNTINLSSDTTFNDKTKVKIVWKYINDSKQPSQGWQIYTSNSTLKTKAEDLGLSYGDTLSSSQGAWVYALKDFTYNVANKNHTLTNSSIVVNDGWNLLSAVDNSNINITDNIFTSTKATFVYRDGQWYVKYNNNPSTAYKLLSSINPYEAFWIYKDPSSVKLDAISVVKGAVKANTKSASAASSSPPSVITI